VIELLLADPNLDVNWGGPLHEACRKKNVGVITLFLASGRWLNISKGLISICKRKGLSGPAKELASRRQEQKAASFFSLILFHCDGLLQLKNKQAT
jgi:hypothetical protein